MLCLWPFRHVSIDQRGRIRPCCSWRFEEWEQYNDVDDIVNFNTSSIQDYINSTFLKQLQENMKNDQFPQGGCSDCLNEISNDRSDRSLLAYGFQKYSMGDSFRIHDMEIKFGNKCNLGCVMCAPSCSSLLEAEAIENFETFEAYGFDGKKSNMQDNSLAWFEREDKMQELAQFASKSKLIRFTGGEPTVNGYLRKFLGYLKLHTTDIDLKLTTNGFKIPSSLLEAVSEFKSVWFDFSIDGVGKVNEFVRWPSKWDSICESIKKCSELPNANITAKTTLHALNVHNIGEICSWIDTNQYVTEWDINLVWEPVYLRCCLASSESKQHFIEQVEKYKDNPKCKVIKTGLTALDNNFDAQQNERLHSKLDKYLAMLNAIRGVDYKDYIKV